MKLSFSIVLFLAVVTVASGIRPTTLPPCSVKETKTINPFPCGTFVAYYTDQSNLVIEHGFAAGKYRDGSENYVGHALNAACQNEYNCPARLKATGDGLGAYMACQDIHYDVVGMRFLLNHPDLKWIETSTSDLFRVPKLVQVRGVHNFFIGRKNFTQSDGSSFSLVAKVYGHNVMSYSMGGGHTNIGAGQFEILSC